METLVHYYQEKLDRNKLLKSTCELRLGVDNQFVVFASNFYTDYNRRGEPNSVTFFHELTINKLNGDIKVEYRIVNSKELSSHKNGTWIKKNSFAMLEDLSEKGLYNGEKRIKYWGVKYSRVVGEIIDKLQKELRLHITDEFLLNKNYYDKSHINPFYELIVDFHLHKKNIKAHDNVYSDIIDIYPKKKWLKVNENKFLPAVLDEYGIKSKYFVGEISSLKRSQRINLRALNYLCKLFGENYIDYVKKVEWKYFCNQFFNKKKLHLCRDEFEKNAIVSTLINFDKSEHYLNNMLLTIYELFELRNFIENRNCSEPLKIKSKNASQLDILFEEWLLIKKHLMVGYKIKYSLPYDFIQDVEAPFEINGVQYQAKVLLTEDDYRLEGIRMKNCMAKQFIHGIVHIFMALQTGRKRINLQYRRGSLIQSYAKANTPVPADIFSEALDILNERMKKYPELEWYKEKYDIITN
jgi:hypothetical protein